jgi:hypothetical protein
MGMQTEMRNLRDLTHEVRTCMQAVPTREEVKEELRDIRKLRESGHVTHPSVSSSLRVCDQHHQRRQGHDRSPV